MRTIHPLIHRPAPDELTAYWTRLREIQRVARALLAVPVYPYWPAERR